MEESKITVSAQEKFDENSTRQTKDTILESDRCQENEKCEALHQTKNKERINIQWLRANANEHKASYEDRSVIRKLIKKNSKPIETLKESHADIKSVRISKLPKSTIFNSDVLPSSVPSAIKTDKKLLASEVSLGSLPRFRNKTYQYNTNNSSSNNQKEDLFICILPLFLLVLAVYLILFHMLPSALRGKDTHHMSRNELLTADYPLAVRLEDMELKLIKCIAQLDLQNSRDSAFVCRSTRARWYSDLKTYMHQVDVAAYFQSVQELYLKDKSLDFLTLSREMNDVNIEFLIRHMEYLQFLSEVLTQRTESHIGSISVPDPIETWAKDLELPLQKAIQDFYTYNRKQSNQDPASLESFEEVKLNNSVMNVQKMVLILGSMTESLLQKQNIFDNILHTTYTKFVNAVKKYFNEGVNAAQMYFDLSVLSTYEYFYLLYFFAILVWLCFDYRRCMLILLIVVCFLLGYGLCVMAFMMSRFITSSSLLYFLHLGFH